MHCMRHTNGARHAIPRNVSSFLSPFFKIAKLETLHVLSFSHSNLSIVPMIIFDHQKYWEKVTNNFFITHILGISFAIVTFRMRIFMRTYIFLKEIKEIYFAH